MRTKMFMLLVGLLAFQAVVGLTSADNGPHGNYAAMTDKCAACHRAHTAAGDSLLAGPATSNDKSEFCYTCHSGGAGAYTDVKNGLFLANADVPDINENTVITDTDRPLMSGGFENVKMSAALTGTLSLPTTSSHMVSGGSNIVWGYGVAGTDNAGLAGVSLTCTNCHNPHGNAGANNSRTFRLLKGNNSGNSALFISETVSLSATIDIPDVTVPTQYYISAKNKSYYWKNTDGTGYPDSYFAQHQASVSGVSVYAKLSQWCSQCHTRYDTALVNGPGHTDSGDAVYGFRHKTNREDTFDCWSCHQTYHSPPDSPHTVYPGCITCHVAHGTGARQGVYGGEVEWPDGTTVPNGNERSALLRLDGRGVCMQCHPK